MVVTLDSVISTYLLHFLSQLNLSSGVFTDLLPLISVECYVKSLGQVELLDLIVQPPSEDVNMEDVEDLRPSKRKVIYNEVFLTA